MDKLKLEPTAALVMQWASKLYNEETVLRFINQLDLSSGKDLFTKCNAVCSWYDEVILNRKYFIRHLIEQQLEIAECENQLVFLAAGKSPLALELLAKNYYKINLIFEIDLSGMIEKKKLYDKVNPKFSNKVRCITADIVSADLVNILNKLEIGYYCDMPTIVLMEGISYYLSLEELKDIIASFQSGMNRNTIIIEYLVPHKFIDKKRRYIPKAIFKIIQEYTGLNEINCYSKNELKQFFREHGGDLTATFSLMDMEFARTLDNKYFKKPTDGWIECVIGNI